MMQNDFHVGRGYSPVVNGPVPPFAPQPMAVARDLVPVGISLSIFAMTRDEFFAIAERVHTNPGSATQNEVRVLAEVIEAMHRDIGGGDNLLDLVLKD